MKKVNQIFSIIALSLLTISAQACNDNSNKKKETSNEVASTELPDHKGATVDKTIPSDVKSSEFIIKAGAVLETLYFNTSDSEFKSIIAGYGKEVTKNGGQLVAQFEVIKKKTERPVTHIAIVQWTDAKGYSKASGSNAFAKVKDKLVDVAFYGSQQDTPVVLRDDKIYDFTSAFTIMTDPCQMPTIMQVMGTYFGKIGPILQKYGIAQTAFVGPHPGAPSTTATSYTPHMMGVFQWNDINDVEKFQNDPDFTEHVDIRNAVMNKMEYIYTKAIL